VCAGELADVVVDGLARELHAASDTGSRIGIEQGRQNLEAKRVMKQYSGLGRQAQDSDRGGRARDGRSGGHGGDVLIDHFICQDKICGRLGAG